jgi:hypothetical protein
VNNVPRNHSIEVCYEVRGVGGEWTRVPIAAGIKLTSVGYLRVILDGLRSYYPPRDFRIVPAAKEKADGK